MSAASILPILHPLVRKLFDVQTVNISDDFLTHLSTYLGNTKSTKYDLQSDIDVTEKLQRLLSNQLQDIECIKLKKFLLEFDSQKALQNTSSILEFLYHLSRLSSPDSIMSSMSSRNPNMDGHTSSGFYSGFNSNLTSQTKQQSISTSNIPYGISLSGNEGRGGITPSLVSLWGQPSVVNVNPRRRCSAATNSRQLPRSVSHSSSLQQPPLSHRTQIQTLSSASKPDILRELVFILNGVGGSLIRHDHLTDAFRLNPDVQLHPGECNSIRRISECGWLHNRIQQFIRQIQEDRLSGPMSQSLASGLHENLTNYYRLVADLESQLGRDVRAASESQLCAPQDMRLDSPALGSQAGSTGFGSELSTDQSTHQPLTLTRLVLWTQEPRFRLRFLASLCDACRTQRGGALASIVHAYTQHGDPELTGLMRHMLRNMATTLLHLISLWIYDGQLDDTFQEFFVACNPSVKKDRLWYDKYSLRRSMIPSFLTPDQAARILITGKSINFLQHACGEKRSIKDQEAIRMSRLKRVESMFEQYSDPSFDRMVSTVYKHTSRYLLETLIERYHFLDHLRATRQFLLLGQGDFITRLMDLIDVELNKPASQLLTHHLSSVLESAIRATNAQYEQPEILQRLDVRLLELVSDETGWDVFSLDYHVDGPLATIFTDECRLMYLRAFNFLWRAKRMEFSLSALWKHQFIASRMEFGLRHDLEPILHLSELLGAEIRHCIQQIQYYINFEVLECAWNALVQKIESATDLDEAIDAHFTFISTVVVRCLLDESSRPLLAQLRSIFNLILNFTELHRELIGIAEEELDAREHYARVMEEMTSLGRWGTDGVKEAQEHDRRDQFVQRVVGPFQARVRILVSSYRDMLINFIHKLRSHPDQSLRFLSDYLNFNGQYSLHSYRSTTSEHDQSDSFDSSNLFINANQ